MSERGASPDPSKNPGPFRGQDDAHVALDRKSSAGESLRLYVSETEPSEIEKRKLVRWLLLALAAFLLHLFFFWILPNLTPTVPPPPVEVTQIDPAKLAAVKNKWKERGFLLSKDEKAPKTKTPEPKDARYESDRNRVVEKEMRARRTNVIPNKSGTANQTVEEKRAQKGSKSQKTSQAVKNIPLSNLSNFRSLPPPGPTEEEQREAQQEGRPGPTGDQALDDRNLPEGAENMLNTVESVYYSFYSRIYEEIGPLWQSRVREVVSSMKLREGTYTTQAEVVFDGNGNYVETNILHSSGYPALDSAVPDSWKKIPRFPNPPRGLIQPDGKIHMGWTFTVQMDQNMNWNYVPPDRVY